MIPREGGNKFSGAFFTSLSPRRVASRQLLAGPEGSRPAERQPASTASTISTSLRAVRSRRTSCGSSRRCAHWSVNAPIAGTFVTDGTRSGDRRMSAGGEDIDALRQGIDDQRISSGLVRLTWQVSPKNKLAAYFDEIDKFRGHAMFAGDDYNTAAVVWNSPAYHTGSAKWTSTVSNRLLLEGGYSNNTEDYTNESLPGRQQAARIGGVVCRRRAPRPRPRVDVGAAAHFEHQHARARCATTCRRSASYVTGSHNMKVGLAADVRPLRPHLRRQRRPRSAVPQQLGTGIPFTGAAERRRSTTRRSCRAKSCIYDTASTVRISGRSSA